MGDRLRVGLAGDDEAHRILAEHLADAATRSVKDLDQLREFVGDGRGGRLLRTGARPPREVMPSGRPRYRSQRLGPLPRGFAAVFIELTQTLAEVTDFALVLVDEDGDDTREDAARLAAAHLFDRGFVQIAFGVCNPIAEAWFVGLLAPSRPARVRALSASLGFNVDRDPHKLASKPGNARHHAKRALHFLLDSKGIDPDKYPSTTPKAAETENELASIDIDHAHLSRLDACGLAGFFRQLVAVYVPAVASRG